MDVGEYDTNTLLTNNISSVAYRIYEPIAPVSSAYTFNASDVEYALRNDGHLVYMDAVRRGIWCFYLIDRAGERRTPEQLGLLATIEACGYRLGFVEEGSFEPASLLKSRTYGSNAINTPGSSASSHSVSETVFRASQTAGLPSATPGHSGMDTEANGTGGSIAEPKRYGLVPVKEVHEFFITAVLASLTTGFCHQVGAIPLNYRNVLLPPRMFPADEDESSRYPHANAFATFRVYLTTTGALVITLSITVSKALVSSADASRLHSLPTGTSLLTAPLGAFGCFQGMKEAESYAADSSVIQSPDTQVSRTRPEASEKFSQWKSTCSKLIQMRGMSPRLLDGCSWLNIQFLQQKHQEYRVDGKRNFAASNGPTAPWPSVLCFRRLWNGVSLEHDSLSPSVENLDPLGYAKTWFQENPEREGQLMKRKKEREMAIAHDTAEADARINTMNAFSPTALHRVGNPGAATAVGTMYPTPPDAVQPLGVTPSFEGNISSPANPQNMVASLDMDVAMSTELPVAEPYSNGWSGADPKREHQVPGFLEGENLFGDLGEDMFENNELTDADFNFFDERPAGDLDLSALQDMGSALDLATSINLASHSTSQKLDGLPGPKPIGPPMVPEFTKPELKHARSTLAGDTRERSLMTGPENSNYSSGIKRQSSPFNPDTVYKRIRASMGGKAATAVPSRNPSARRESAFEKVDFDPSLSLVARKYEGSGQYQCNLSPSTDENSRKHEDSNLLTIREPTRMERKRPALRGLPSTLRPLMAKISGEAENATSLQTSIKRDDPSPDSDDMSLVSDQEDSSQATDEPSSPTKSSVFRRLMDDDVVSMVASLKELDGSAANSPNYGGIDLSRLSNSDGTELPLAKYFADSDPSPLRISCPDDDFVTIAQILTEQAATGSLRLGPLKPPNSVELFEARRELSGAMRHTMRDLQAALPRSLGEVTECRLRPLLEVQDLPYPLPATRVQPRPNGQEVFRPNMFHLPSPHLEVRRYDTNLAVSSSALSFWESLGLGPAQGSKDITSICVFPNWEGLRDSAAAFIDRIRSIYEALKLGSFETLPTAAGLTDGLVGCDFDPASASPEFGMPHPDSACNESMSRLSEALMALNLVEKNLVVFFIYLPDDPTSIVEACAAFQGLYQKYKASMMEKKKTITNDLVLQLVPLDNVAAETSLVVLPTPDYIRLAVETYDRCTMFGGPMPAPAIVLEPGLPRMIDFKLASTPSPDLLQENSCMHIAYAQSIDSRWVSAAWTDNRGTKQMTASYCLGRRGKTMSTPMIDVFREIWDTTRELVSVLRVHWRVIVTKCGPLEQAEIEAWDHLAKSDPNTPLNLTLMTVDTNPSLQLIPPALKLPSMTQPAQYTTPVSTPQSFPVLSPEQSGNPATPAGTAGGNAATTPGVDSSATELDADASLVDVTDTTWGAIASHRLNNSLSLTDLSPALASGYLIKRCSHRLDEPLAVLEVNVVHSEGNPRLMDTLLKEMLVYFRCLATLARMRGMVDRETDTRPWHIAAAEKGARALYQLM